MTLEYRKQQFRAAWQEFCDDLIAALTTLCVAFDVRSRLLRYNPLHDVCPKCGGDCTNPTFHDWPIFGEILELRCAECGATWMCLPLDAK